jgi:hypothetical protein
MSKLLGRSWWESLGLGKPPIDDGDDFGDMGTAFGLDASMGGATPTESARGSDPIDAKRVQPASDRLKRRSRF